MILERDKFICQHWSLYLKTSLSVCKGICIWFYFASENWPFFFLLAYSSFSSVCELSMPSFADFSFEEVKANFSVHVLLFNPLLYNIAFFFKNRFSFDS